MSCGWGVTRSLPLPGADKIYQPAHRAPLLNQEAELLQNYHPALRAPLLSRRGAKREAPRLAAKDAGIHPSFVRRGAKRENHPVSRGGCHPSLVRR
jgi:hypothetical protein